MITDPIPAQDIRYNPASACFEAKVTVHGAGPARVYACELQGDLSQSEEEIAAALRTEALRRHVGRQGLCSSRPSTEPRPQQTKMRTAARPANWLSRLPALTLLRAA